MFILDLLPIKDSVDFFLSCNRTESVDGDDGLSQPRAELRRQAELLTNDLTAVDMIFGEWQGRKNFPRLVEWPSDYFAPEAVASDREREKLRQAREEILRQRWKPGAYCVVLMCTENEILLDENGEIPHARIEVKNVSSFFFFLSSNYMLRYNRFQVKYA